MEKAARFPRIPAASADQEKSVDGIIAATARLNVQLCSLVSDHQLIEFTFPPLISHVETSWFLEAIVNRRGGHSLG